MGNKAVKAFPGYTTLTVKKKKKSNKESKEKGIKDLSVTEQTDMSLETNGVLVSCLIKTHKYQ